MEIERKFLVRRIPPETPDRSDSKAIVQGYISADPVIRVRKTGGEHYLTIKGEGLTAREEFELKITERQFSSLLDKVSGNLIEKTRRRIPLRGGLTAELDIYGGGLAGLLTVEVEFGSEEDAGAFVPPDWFGAEVSADARYQNNNLAFYGAPETRNNV